MLKYVGEDGKAGDGTRSTNMPEAHVAPIPRRGLCFCVQVAGMDGKAGSSVEMININLNFFALEKINAVEICLQMLWIGLGLGSGNTIELGLALESTSNEHFAHLHYTCRTMLLLMQQ